MKLIPEVPRKDGAARAPAAGEKRETVLDGLARPRTDEQGAAVLTRTAIPRVVGVIAPAEPHPEGVVRGQEQAHAYPLAKREQVIPILDHVGLEASDWLLEVAVTAPAV